MTFAPAMTIKLVRHGQSLANTHEALPHLSGDAGIGLTELGKQQALAVGETLGGEPRNTGEALTGASIGVYWRYRVGDYRVICDIQDGRLCVLVIEIGNRREVYK